MSAETGLHDAPLTFQQWSEILARNVDPETETPWRRSSRRYHARGEVKLSHTDDGRTCKHLLTLLNISDEGLSGRCTREMPENIRVELRVAMNGAFFMLLGRIRHCAGTLGGYKVGVQLIFPESEPQAEAAP